MSPRSPTLPDVVEALLAPTAAAAAAGSHTEVARLRDEGRDVALELRRLVHGELRGMFDGPTTPGLALDGAAVVLDLSALYHSPALGVLVTCARRRSRRPSSGRGQRRTILVVDEAWAVLANLGVARFLQSSWKLARARGIGERRGRAPGLRPRRGRRRGERRRRASPSGLVADSETIVCLRAARVGDRRRRGGARALRRGGAPRRPPRSGVALWKVAGRSFLVEHRLAPGERALVDTDRRLLADS